MNLNTPASPLSGTMDVVIAALGTVEEMKAYREDMRNRVAAHGRDEVVRFASRPGITRVGRRVYSQTAPSADTPSDTCVHCRMKRAPWPARRSLVV